MKEKLGALLRQLMVVDDAWAASLQLYNLLELHKIYSLYVETIATYYKVDVTRSYWSKRLRLLTVEQIQQYDLHIPYPEYLSDLIDVWDAIEFTIQVEKYCTWQTLNLPMQKILNIINVLSWNEKQ